MYDNARTFSIVNKTIYEIDDWEQLVNVKSTISDALKVSVSHYNNDLIKADVVTIYIDNFLAPIVSFVVSSEDTRYLKLTDAIVTHSEGIRLLNFFGFNVRWYNDDPETTETLEQFKTTLVNSLNDRFGIHISMDNTSTEMVSEITSALIANSVDKHDIIDSMNRNFGANLSIDATTTDIINAILTTEIAITPKSLLIVNINTHFGINIPDTPDTDIAEIVRNLLNIETSQFTRSVITNSLNNHFEVSLPIYDTTAELASEISNIPTYTEGFNTAKAEDEPIITELQSEVSILSQDKPIIVNAINANFDTSISTDLTASEVASEVAEIPTASEARTDVIDIINTSTGSTLTPGATDEEIKSELSTLATPANLWNELLSNMETAGSPLSLPFITDSDGRDKKTGSDAVSSLQTTPINFGKVDTSGISFMLREEGIESGYGAYASTLNFITLLVKEIDMDFSSSSGVLGNLYADGYGEYNNFFNATHKVSSLLPSVLKNLTIRGLSNVSLRGVSSMANLEKITIIDEPMPSSPTRYSAFLSQCPNLVTVDGIEIDLSNVPDLATFNSQILWVAVSRSFAKTPRLENIRFKKDSIKFRFYMDDCKALSQDSTLSLINALDTNMPNTISLHTDVKTKCDAWRGKLVDGIWVVTDEPIDDVNVFSFKTIIAKKNWAIG